VRASAPEESGGSGTLVSRGRRFADR